MGIALTPTKKTLAVRRSQPAREFYGDGCLDNRFHLVSGGPNVPDAVMKAEESPWPRRGFFRSPRRCRPVFRRTPNDQSGLLLPARLPTLTHPPRLRCRLPVSSPNQLSIVDQIGSQRSSRHPVAGFLGSRPGMSFLPMKNSHDTYPIHPFNNC
jgi:hypothetical protein